MKIRHIPDHVYFRDVYLVAGNDEELRRWTERKDPGATWKARENGRWMRFDENGFHTHYILISTKNDGAWLTAILAHEVLHLTFAVLASAGITYCDASEEAFTYYFQSMFAASLKRLPKK